MDFASPLAPVPAGSALIASAIMRFSASDKPCACPLMDPMVRAFTISSGGSFLKTDRSGARWPALLVAWHIAQCCSNS
jgi:hypothetical protein